MPQIAAPPRRLAWSSWAIDHPLPVAVLFALLALVGTVSAFLLPVQRYPDLSFPTVIISTTWPGTAANQIETAITRPIERGVSGLPGVQAVFSTIAPGVSNTVIEFPIGDDIGADTDTVRARIEQIRANLPAGANVPVVRQAGADEVPILAYAVTADKRSLLELSHLIDSTITGALQQTSGVGAVLRVGGNDREINVIADPARMAASGVTLPQLSDVLRRVSRNDPAGMARIGGAEQPLRIVNGSTNVEDLATAPLPLAGGRQLRLSDVASVGEGIAEPRQFARLNGEPAVAIQIARNRGASEVSVEAGVRATLDKLSQADPDLHFTPIYSTVSETRASLDATISALLEGILLTTLAVWLFLRDWRSTAIAAIAMPASLLPTLAGMLALGFSLNIVTLLALTLVIGILVDDAIVEVENIQHYLDAGAPPKTAAREGAAAIGLAVIATTLAIVVVFLPVSFMAGVPGRFFHEFGITVSLAVLASLAVARLLTPVLAARFLLPVKPKPAKHQSPPSWLVFACTRPWRVLLLALAMVLATALMIPFMSTGFQPAGNPDQIFVKVQGPPGAGASDMERAIAGATDLMRAQPEVLRVFAQVGTKISGGTGGDRGLADIRDATITVIFRPGRETTALEFRERLRNQLKLLPDARVNFLGDTAGADVQTILAGEDPAKLDATARELIAQMRRIPALDDPRLTDPVGAPELVVIPDRATMARLGVTVDTLSAVLRVATIGDTDANLAKLDSADEAIPIRLRLPDAARADLDTLRALQVPTTMGVTTLGALAKLDFAMAQSKLARFDQHRQIAVEADLRAGYQYGDALAAIRKLPVMQHLPDGIAPRTSGNARSMEQLFRSLALVFGTAIVLLYALLVLLLGDLRRPLVVLSALPPAATGALFVLLAGGWALDLPALIGLLMLLGLVAKNSILIIDHAAQGEKAGLPATVAILEAVQTRARPILMTTLAMIAGMVPTVLALGQGSEFRQPMAVAIIGGLISSTITSLGIVPAFYLLIVGRKRPPAARSE